MNMDTGEKMVKNELKHHDKNGFFSDCIKHPKKKGMRRKLQEIREKKLICYPAVKVF